MISNSISTEDPAKRIESLSFYTSSANTINWIPNVLFRRNQYRKHY